MGLKNWLSRTGIYHPNGEELLDEINPLKKVIEHPDYPLARIYRTSFFKGIKDTFSVLVGKHYYSDKGRKGVLDLLIFPLIARIGVCCANGLLYDVINNNRDIVLQSLQVVAFVVLLAISLPLLAGRFVLGAALTLILIPVIAIVHAVTYPQSMRYQKEIQKLEIMYEGELRVVGKEKIYWFEIDCANKRLPLRPVNRLENTFIEMNGQNARGIEALLAINMHDILRRRNNFEEDRVAHLKEVRELRQWLDALKIKRERRRVPLQWMKDLEKKFTANGVSTPGAAHEEFQAQIRFFAGVATHEEAKKAQKEITEGQSVYRQ